MALDPGGLLGWLLAGLLAGVLASHFMRGHGHGLVGDIVLGVVGAFLGGLLASVLGFGGTAGFWATIVIAFIGAAVLLAVLYSVAPAARRRRLWR